MNLRIVNLKGLLHKEGTYLDIEEILKLCESRNVDISWRYDRFWDKFIVRVRRNNYCVERAFRFEDCLNVAFGLTIRIILRDMINEIDEATGGERQ